MWSCNRGMCKCVAVIGVEWAVVRPLLRGLGLDARNGLCLFLICVCAYCKSILVLVLGEKEKVFAQWAGKLWHLFAPMVSCAGSITFPLLNTPVDLETEKKKTGGLYLCFKVTVNAVKVSTGYLLTCTRMSARCLSLAWRRSVVLISWMNQDPLLVLRMAAVPWGGSGQTIKA